MSVRRRSDPLQAAGSLILRADASPTIGLGHTVRCLALALAARESGYAPTFVSQRSGAAAMELVRAANVPLVIIDADDEASDAAQTTEVVAHTGAGAVVVDHYGLGVEWWRAVRRSCFLAAVDDEGREFLGPEVDLVLNQNPYARPEWYAGARRVLSGLRYALLRPAFRTLRNAGQAERDSERILVTLGGADTQSLSGIVLAGLAELNPPIDVDLIVGPAASFDASLASGLYRVGRLRVHCAPSNLPELMARATLAITAGGSTIYELACLGVPSLAVEVAPNQKAICDAVCEAGAIESLGHHSKLTPSRVRDQVATLLREPSRLARMTSVGRSLVDGWGARRVVMALDACRGEA